MTFDRMLKRRMKLLKELAEKARWRRDVGLPLSEVDPTLDIIHYGRGATFVDKTNPAPSGWSDLAYDLNTLNDEELIVPCYLDSSEQDEYGGIIEKDPGVRVTAKGLQALADMDKSWLRKAIDKEPVTFLQIVITIVVGVGSSVGGWVVGRYLTPSTPEQSPAPIVD